MVSAMQDVLQFLSGLGFFDVLLPWLMMYVMIFALLERTQVFGVEKVGDKTYSKKNLNAIFALAVSFFAIMSAQVVGTIHRAIGPIMLFLLFIILFLMLVSVFHKGSGYHEFKGRWKTGIIWAVLIVILLIFAGSIQTSSGMSWLEWVWVVSSNRVNTGVVGAIVLLLIVAGIIGYLGKSPAPPEGKDKKDEDK